MTARRRTVLAALMGASLTLLAADTSYATTPDQPLEPPRLPDNELEADIDIDIDALEPDQEISDPGPAEAIRSVIGRRSNRRIDSLAVSLFGDEREALWPMQVGVEVVSVDGEAGEVIVPLRDVVVSHGQHTMFSEVIEAPRGSHTFELELVARHHFGDAIELEYDLDIRQAHFESLTWGNYLLHRVALAPRPEVGDDALAAARADIVEIEERPSEPAHRQIITVEGQRYEIRLYAETLRG